MEAQKPTIGRIVHYFPNETDDAIIKAGGGWPQTKMPASIVAVHSDTCVTLKIQVCGAMPDLWKTSVLYGDPSVHIAGTWHWPVRE